MGEKHAKKNVTQLIIVVTNILIGFQVNIPVLTKKQSREQLDKYVSRAIAYAKRFSISVWTFHMR